MKKFNSIQDFINYAPICLFCGNRMNIHMSGNLKVDKHNYGEVLHRINGSPMFRDTDTVKPFGSRLTTYHYSGTVTDNKYLISCQEKYYGDSPTQFYDVMVIDLNNSTVELKQEVSIGILNAFVRMNFVFLQRCLKCGGHAYTSTPIIAGAKSKKLMPFFLRSEVMLKTIGGEGSYSLKSNYQLSVSKMEKSILSSEWSNISIGYSPSSSNELPMIDLSNIKTAESFENKIESYITFS